MTPERIAELWEASGATLICRICDNRLLDDGWSVCSACGGQFARAKEMLDEIERLQTLVPRWQSTESGEDLLEPGLHVLVTDGDAVEIGYFSGSRWESCDGADFDDEHPCIAWMPLPDPPEVA